MNKIRWIFLSMFLGQSLAYSGTLYQAAQEGDFYTVQNLLASGANIEDKGVLGTPLIAAASFDQAMVVQELLKHGADINAIGNNRKTAPELALDLGRYQALNIIIQWSIENQIRLPALQYLKEKSKDLGLSTFDDYDEKFSYRQKSRKAIEESTNIPRDLRMIIEEYLGSK